MKNREQFITCLQAQRDSLGHLIAEIEIKKRLSRGDYDQYDAVTRQVEKDLQKLRQKNKRR